jgi:hypothetical protein
MISAERRVATARVVRRRVKVERETALSILYPAVVVAGRYRKRAPLSHNGECWLCNKGTRPKRVLSKKRRRENKQVGDE